jgi:peptide deformylase
MAIRNIVKEGEPVLRKTSRSVLNFDDRLAELIDDMVQTMYEAEGCGLAAPQVGILRRVVVIDVGEGVIELVNPVIVETSGEQEGLEGCLSCPGEWGITIRPNYVKVKAFDRNGNEFTVDGEELLAKAFCHELDHLDGILYKEKVIRMVLPEELEEN